MTSVTDQVTLPAVEARDQNREVAGAPVDRAMRACLIGAGIGFVPFLLVLWDFGVRPLRRMTADGVNADFFDIQARALFHGHLDVPRDSLGIEAFVVDGRHYMYFGPFLAILRMPILLVTDRLDGRLTALSMLAGWLVLAAAVIVLVRRVRRTLYGEAPVSRFEAVGLAAIVASVTGGSTIVYLASQPWVYHEVYIWSTALTVATVASLIAAWDDLTTRRIALTAALALATMLTRSTAGWAMAFALVGTGLLIVVSRRPAGRRGLWLMAGGAGVVLVGASVNWAKFRHPYLFPIEDQVWTRHSAHRRIVIATNGGGIDGLQFVRTTLAAYFRPDGVRFTTVFPFISAPAGPPSPAGDVLLDDSWRTGSVPALMPLLFVSTLWGVAVAFANRAAAALRIPLLACLAMTGGVIAFGHVAQRYTSEFLPLVTLGAIIGFVDVARRMRSAADGVKRAVGTAICLLAIYGIVAHGAIGLVNARVAWRGDRLADLVGVQLAVADALGRDVNDRVRFVATLPERGAADALAVVGDCDALYLGTGELHGSWVPVEHRDRHFRLDVAATDLRPGSTSLMWFSGHTVRRLHVQINLSGQVRLVMIGAAPDTSGHWLVVQPGESVDVSVSADPETNRFVATASVAGSERRSVVDAPMTEWNHQFRSVPVGANVALRGAAEAAAIGLSISVAPGPVPDLCERLR